MREKRDGADEVRGQLATLSLSLLPPSPLPHRSLSPTLGARAAGRRAVGAAAPGAAADALRPGQAGRGDAGPHTRPRAGALVTPRYTLGLPPPPPLPSPHACRGVCYVHRLWRRKPRGPPLRRCALATGHTRPPCNAIVRRMTPPPVPLTIHDPRSRWSPSAPSSTGAGACSSPTPRCSTSTTASRASPTSSPPPRCPPSPIWASIWATIYPYLAPICPAAKVPLHVPPPLPPCLTLQPPHPPATPHHLPPPIFPRFLGGCVVVASWLRVSSTR